MLFFLSAIGITSIITKSLIFKPFRDLLDNEKEGLYENFLGNLVTCAQCTGFWVGILLSYMWGTQIGNYELSDGLFAYSFAILCDASVCSLLSWITLIGVDLLINLSSLIETKDVEIQSKLEDLLL